MTDGSGPRRAAAIFDATLRLLAEHGYERLTIEGVAEHAGVNKTTIYRWWPSKAALVGAALLDAPSVRLAVPDTGSLRGDLTILGETVARLLTEPPSAALAVTALGAAVQNPDLGAAARAFFADRLASELPIFDRAAERGELAPDVDPTLVVDALAGAIWTRIVLRQRPVDDGYPARIAAVLCAGVAPSTGS